MNWQTIVIASVIAVIVLAIVIKGIYNRKKGKSSCSGACGSCAMKNACHPQNKK